MATFKNDNEIFGYLIHKMKNELIRESIDEIKNEMRNEQLIQTDDEVFYTSKEVCKIYKISASTLNRYVNNGLQYQSGGYKCKRLFNKNLINKYLNQRNHD
jgi:hypothetical protein